MSELIDNIAMLATAEGYNRTSVKGVAVYKDSVGSKRIPLLYSQGIIFVVQGRKRIYLEQSSYDYNPNQYLVLTLPMPAECETFVEPGEPMLSVMINLDVSLLNEMVHLFDVHRQNQVANLETESKGLYVCKCNNKLLDAITRLSQCLNSPLQSDVLGGSLVREVLFYVLNGPNAAPIFALASQNTRLSRLERVIKHLNDHYQERLDVDQLAAMANMSASSFHRHFKQVTNTSPIKYVKKIRLNRARELLVDKGLKVKQAAEKVGYESPTQFSREFTRYFGENPRDC